jgi:integrase
MSVYKRGGVWWFKFKFQGVVIRESTGLTQKESARDVERKRHLQLKEGRAGIERAARVPLFSVAAEAWLKTKTDEWAAKTAIIERTNLNHLKPFFGNRLLNDISPADVGAYREQRLRAKAAHKTIALEIGTVRGIMLFYDLDANWRNIRKKVKLKKSSKLGRVITAEEQASLLRECQASRSRSLPIAVTLALETGMRYSEIRLLQWRQIDFGRQVLTVGQSKTDAGTGREIPMNSRLKQVLEFWAANFPHRKPNHYVFPFERYGGKGEDEKFGFNGSIVYNCDPMKPIGDWKEGWEAAKKRAGVECRFHDLRHLATTRLLEAGVSHPIVAEIMGWSASTAIRMIKEVYGHIGLAARRQAIDQVERYMLSQVAPGGDTTGAQKGAQSENHESEQVQ